MDQFVHLFVMGSSSKTDHVFDVVTGDDIDKAIIKAQDLTNVTLDGVKNPGPALGNLAHVCPDG